MVCEELRWKVLKKNCYNVDTGEVEILKFLRMSHNDQYNKEWVMLMWQISYKETIDVILELETESGGGGGGGLCGFGPLAL